jgi:hypothetical protein
MIYILSPQSMLPVTSILFEGVPKSVDYSKFLLVGLRNGHIVECDISKNAKETIMHSHHDGEVWGLAVLEEQGMFVTSCDDNKLLMYEVAKRKCVQRGQVTVGGDGGSLTKTMDPKKRVERIGGASTMSMEPPENQSRALAWNSKLKHLAVANNLGKVTVRQVTFERGSDLNNVIKTINDPKEWIECMQYNPKND